MRYGFLGYNASFMLDLVVCALIVVVPVLLYSIYQVKFRRNFSLHKKLQIGLAVILFVAVSAFEIDLQIVHQGWKNVVNQRVIPLNHEQMLRAEKMLRIHLVFAVSTPVLWAVTIAYALRRFPRIPAPGEHSLLHRRLAWLSTIDLTLTSITGLVFYYFAFVI